MVSKKSMDLKKMPKNIIPVAIKRMVAMTFYLTHYANKYSMNILKRIMH